MKQARYPLNLPQQLRPEAEAWAKRQGVLLNQFILWAIAEKVGALNQGLDDPQFPQIAYRRGASGIRVQAVAVAHIQWGMSAREIAAEYGLSAGMIEGALAFFEAHKAEIETHQVLEKQLAGRESG